MATGTPSPYIVIQEFTDAGAPAAGYKLFTYNAGTAVKATTWTDVGMLSANTDPIILDAAGRATIFLLPGTSYKYVLAPPTDTDPPVSPIWTRDNISAINASDNVVFSGGLVVGFAGTVTADQIKLGDANFFLDWNSGTVPRIVFDGGLDDFRFTRATNMFELVIANVSEVKVDPSGMQITDGLNVGFAGTPVADTIAVGDATCALSNIGASPTWTADTNDFLNFGRADNTFRFNVNSLTVGSVGPLGVGGAIGGTVASAGTITPTGNLFHVSGTTTITSINASNVPNAAYLTIIFDGVLTLTDGSNLKLAGNFVTSADDSITLINDNGNFYEVCRSVN